MGEDAGHRGGDDLVRLGADGDRRRHADENQRGRHEKAAAHPEQAGQKTDQPAQPKQQEGVERNLGDREVNLHFALGTRRPGVDQQGRAGLGGDKLG